MGTVREAFSYNDAINTSYEDPFDEFLEKDKQCALGGLEKSRCDEENRVHEQTCGVRLRNATLRALSEPSQDTCGWLEQNDLKSPVLLSALTIP